MLVARKEWTLRVSKMDYDFGGESLSWTILEAQSLMQNVLHHRPESRGSIADCS